MSIDLSQFHAVFFEESFEGLELMEAALLDLDVDNPDSEQINAIFRAAHSIKGGSGTFGFVQVSEFTHILETLLDKVRDGGHAIDAHGIELFLQSVDCLRGLLEALQAEQEPDLQRANQLTAVFQAVLDGATYADSSSQVNTNPPQDKGINEPLGNQTVTSTRLDRWYTPDIDDLLCEFEVLNEFIYKKKQSDHYAVLLTLIDRDGDLGHERETFREEVMEDRTIQDEVKRSATKAWDQNTRRSYTIAWTKMNDAIYKILRRETNRRRHKERIEITRNIAEQYICNHFNKSDFG